MKYDDIVIGAGVSGLSTAILLAQNGRKVAVVEKAPAIAPTIRGFTRDGVYFDTGFHYAAMLGKGCALARLFERLGILPHLRIKENGQTSGDLFFHVPSGFKFQFGETLQDLMVQLTEAFPDEANAIKCYISDLRHLVDQIQRKLFTVVLDPARLFENADLSLGRYLQENFKSPLLQTLLSIHAVLYGSWPDETSLQYHSMITGGYYDQSQQIYNGGHAIAQAFDKELKNNGIDLYTNSAVDQVRLNDSKTVKAVYLENGNVIECENCIYTAHPRLLITMLPKDVFRPIYRNRLVELEDTTSAVVLYCKRKKACSKTDFNTLILAHSLFPGLYADTSEFGNRPLFISHSISDRDTEGISIICPWKYEDMKVWEASGVGNRSSAYSDWKERIAETILHKAMENCSDIIGELDIIDVATPLTFRDYMNAPHGSLYGAKHQLSDMPLLPRTRIKGLYLSGQATLATGVMGAMLSGFQSAALITGEDYRETMES
ncbi:MAG: NAD(P)/FAD-dependent oxidoreductase [Planctomycetota bacterium]